MPSQPSPTDAIFSSGAPERRAVLAAPRDRFRIAALLSLVLHGVLILALQITLPTPAPSEPQSPKSVEVELAPEPEKQPPASPKPDSADEKKDEKRADAPHKADPAPERRDEAGPPARRPPEPPPPPPERSQPAPKKQAEAPKRIEPPPAPAEPAPPTPAPASPPAPPPVPPEERAEAAPAPPPAEKAPEGRSAPDDATPPLPDDRKILGRWELEPLTVDLGHRCGTARLSGDLALIQKRGEGRWYGVLTTRIAWAKCQPERAQYDVELRISGETALLIGPGFTDRGLYRDGAMVLRDAYGISVWRRR